MARGAPARRELSGLNVRVPLSALSAVGCLAALAVVGGVLLGLPAGHRADAAILRAFAGVYDGRLERSTAAVAASVNVWPYACAGVLLVVIAAARRQGWRALVVAVLLVATGATTQLLKQLVSSSRPEPWLTESTIGAHAWPSGHATAAMTLALCAIIVAPPALRAVVAMLGGAFAVAVGYALLVRSSHFPSDVIGGFLVAAFWTSLGLAALQRLDRDRAVRARTAAAEVLTPFVGGAVLVGAGSLAVRAAGASFALDRGTLLAGAALVAIAGLALVATVSAACGRAQPRGS
jgi:membrane-associated phospholipid phosphatase